MMLDMKIVHCLQIQIGKHVGIVNNEWLIAIQKFPCFEHATTGIEQQIALIADVDIQSKIVMAFQIFNNFVAKMMDIHCDIIYSGSRQMGDYALEHRATTNFHQRLRAVVGERTESCA